MPDSNAVLITDTSLPSAISQALQAAEIAFSIHQADAINSTLRLHAVLLQHGNNELMVVLPRTHILDLSQLNAATQITWQATPVATVAKILNRYGLSTLPALPKLFNVASLCDPAIFMHPVVYIDSGVPGLVIGLQPTALDLLFNSSQRITCSELTSSNLPNDGSVETDAQGIEHAVIRLTSRRIHQRLEETLEIPLLSSTAKKVLRLRTDPLAGVDELTAIVETDPSLAAQVISWAASPYYAAPGKIRSVEDAIVRVLGFDLVINLALGLSLGKSLTLPKDQPRHCTPYWQQAIYTAALIEGLARAMPTSIKPESGLAYLGGLLHNFGFALLAYVFPPHFSLVCRSLEANLHLSHSVVEHHLLGITREQMGAWLMQCWNIPDELIYALRFQDNPDYQDSYASYANLNCLAQRLLAQHGIGCVHDSSIPDALYQRLGISADTAQQALQRVLDAEQALQELAHQFSQP